MEVVVPREDAVALERAGKFSKNRLLGLINPVKPLHQMANEPAIDKVMLTVQVSIAEKKRLQIEAKTRGFQSLSDYLRFLIHEGTKNVTLLPEDYEEIASTIRRNQASRDRKRVG